MADRCRGRSRSSTNWPTRLGDEAPAMKLDPLAGFAGHAGLGSEAADGPGAAAAQGRACLADGAVAWK